MEKIRLLELDIDINQLLKKGGDTFETIEDLKSQAKEYKKELKTTGDSIKQYANELSILEKQGKSNTSEFKDQQSKLKLLVDSQEENKIKLQETNASLREQKAEYRDINRTIDAYNATANQELNVREGTDGSIKELNAKLTANKDLYRGLSEEQRNNADVGGKLKETIEAQDSKYKELQNSIGTTAVNVGDYENKQGRLLGSTNMLTKGLQSQLSSIPLVGKFLASTSSKLVSYSSSQISATGATSGATKGLGRFRVALISTGIGAIVIALVAMALAMSKSQKVMDKFKQVTAAVGAVVNVVVDLLVSLGETLFDALSNPVEAWDSFTTALSDGYEFIKAQVVDRLTASFTLMKNSILKNILEMRIAWNNFWGDSEEADELTNQLNELESESAEASKKIEDANKKVADSFEVVKGAVTSVINEMEAEAKKAIELEKRFQDLTKSATLFTAEASQANREISDKKAQAALAEQNGNISEAIKLYEEANLQLQEMQGKQIQLKENELANSLDLDLSLEEDTEKFEAFVSQLREADVDFNNLSESAEISKTLISEIGLSTSTLDDLDEIVGKFTELNTEVANSDNKQRSNTQKLISLEKKRRSEAIKAAKERTDAEIEAARISLDTYLINNETINNSLDQRITIFQRVLDTESDILKKQLDAKTISQEEYELGLLQLKKDFAEKSANATSDNLQNELDLFIENNQSVIDEYDILSEDLIQKEEERLNLIYNKRLEVLNQQKESELISESDFNLQKLQLTQEYLESDKSLKESFKEQEREIEELDYNNKLELDQLRTENQFELRLNELERRRQIEIEHAEKVGADTALINEKYAEQQKRVEKEITDYKLNQRTSIISGLKGLVDEETQIGKALAVAEITNNTAQNVNKILGIAAVQSSNPVTAPLAVNSFIQAGIVSATGVAQIAKTVGLFRDGGELIGNSHSNGGIPFTIDGQPGFEAEGGEFIVNKRSYKMFRPLVNYINDMGVRGKTPNGLFQNGGELTSSIKSNTNSATVNEGRLAKLIGNAIGEANKNLPNPITDIKDVARELNSLNNIKDTSSL